MMSRVVPACGETIATSATRQLIHQRRLADVRGPCDRNDQTLAQPFTAPLLRQHVLDFSEQRFDLGKRRRDQLGGHITLVGEIIPASISAEASMIWARQSRARSPSNPFN